MSMINLNPFPVIPDLVGEPLDNGYIYVGEPDNPPEQFPKTVFWDEGMTRIIAQPIRTSMGRVWNQGSPAAVYVSGKYSIRVLDSNGAQVFIALNVSPLGA